MGLLEEDCLTYKKNGRRLRSNLEPQELAAWLKQVTNQAYHYNQNSGILCLQHGKRPAAEILTWHNQQQRFCLCNTSTSQEFFRLESDRETQAHSLKQYIAFKIKGVS